MRNLYAGQEATVRTGHGTTDWFQIGKEFVKAVYCHPAYLTYKQSTSREMLGWRKHKLESRLPGEISNNLRYADDTTLMTEREEELKSLLMKVKLLGRVRLFATPRTVACQAPPSMGFPRQECWSGLPFPSPDPINSTVFYLYIIVCTS